jgi:hypothetical protein
MTAQKRYRQRRADAGRPVEKIISLHPDDHADLIAIGKKHGLGMRATVRYLIKLEIDQEVINV